MHCLSGILIPVNGTVKEPVSVQTSPSAQPHLCKCCGKMQQSYKYMGAFKTEHNKGKATLNRGPVPHVG